MCLVKYQGEIIQIMEVETSTVIRLAVTKDSYCMILMTLYISHMKGQLHLWMRT